MWSTGKHNTVPPCTFWAPKGPPTAREGLVTYTEYLAWILAHHIGQFGGLFFDRPLHHLMAVPPGCHSIKLNACFGPSILATHPMSTPQALPWRGGYIWCLHQEVNTDLPELILYVCHMCQGGKTIAPVRRMHALMLEDLRLTDLYIAYLP